MHTNEEEALRPGQGCKKTAVKTGFREIRQAGSWKKEMAITR